MRVFTEIQRFDQWWFRLVILGVMACTIIPVAFAWEEIEADSALLWIVLVACGLAFALLFLVAFGMKLKTRIDEQGIHYGFWPFHLSLRIIPWRDITECYVRTYSPIGEYGGWGYRIGFRKKGKALNVKGDRGIQIVLKDSKRLLIGTQLDEQAQKTITLYHNKNKTHV